MYAVHVPAPNVEVEFRSANVSPAGGDCEYSSERPIGVMLTSPPEPDWSTSAVMSVHVHAVGLA